jgi:hypothetical protein
MQGSEEEGWATLRLRAGPVGHSPGDVRMEFQLHEGEGSMGSAMVVRLHEIEGGQPGRAAPSSFLMLQLHLTNREHQVSEPLFIMVVPDRFQQLRLELKE